MTVVTAAKAALCLRLRQAGAKGLVRDQTWYYLLICCWVTREIKDAETTKDAKGQRATRVELIG